MSVSLLSAATSHPGERRDVAAKFRSGFEVHPSAGLRGEELRWKVGVCCSSLQVLLSHVDSCLCMQGAAG